MRGKRASRETIENGLNRFLEDDLHLVLGFEKGDQGVALRVFKGKVEGLSLLNPVFALNSALYLRRLFAKGTRIILLLRPCEIRAYVELQKLSQIEREDIIAVSIDCFGAVSSKEPDRGYPFGRRTVEEYLKEPHRCALGLCNVQGEAGGRGGRGRAHGQRRRPLGIPLHREGGRFRVAPGRRG